MQTESNSMPKLHRQADVDIEIARLSTGPVIELHKDVINRDKSQIVIRQLHQYILDINKQNINNSK